MCRYGVCSSAPNLSPINYRRSNQEKQPNNIHIPYIHVIWWTGAVPGHFLGIVRQDPNDSTSDRSHVDIFRFCFHSFEVYSRDSSKMIGKFPEVLNFNRLFLELNRFTCNQPPVLPGHRTGANCTNLKIINNACNESESNWAESGAKERLDHPKAILLIG